MFKNRAIHEVMVSDLTYVRVLDKWCYICLIVDVGSREFVGYAARRHKDASFVLKVFASIKQPLDNIKIFHTDRGSEFKNKLIEDLLDTFNIERSLSHKGCPYGNAVAEAAFKVIKAEFAFNRVFKSLEELERELFDYVKWYNTIRIHCSLNFLTPTEYRLQNCP